MHDLASLQKLLDPLFPGLMSTKFIAGARVNTVVTAECQALHRGRTTLVWQTSIRNAEGKLCAVVTQTQLVLEATA